MAVDMSSSYILTLALYWMCTTYVITHYLVDIKIASNMFAIINNAAVSL